MSAPDVRGSLPNPAPRLAAARRRPLERRRPLRERRAATGSPARVGAAALGWYAAESLRHRREGAFGYDLETELDVASPDFLRAAEALTGAPISEGNEAELLINGDRIFPAMLETIRSAERTLNVQTYVYWRGEIATEVSEAICERARAGVRCNVILDALGAVQMERSLIREMRDAGARVILFRPPKPYAVKRLANRTHRRVLVADGRVGMTGGVGIAEEWTGDAEDPDHWRDTHVRVRGPVVRGFQGTFAENWLEATGEVLAGDGYLPDLEPIADGGPMQLVRSSAKVGDTNAEALYYLAIASAQELDRPDRRLLRPPAGVHRRALLGGRARRAGADRRPRPAHRQGLRPRRRARRLRAAARRPGSSSTSTSRRCCTRSRWSSTAPGRRSGRSTSTTARSSSTTR